MPEDWNEVICIDDWLPDESSYENGYYPEGARDKAVYFSPEDVAELPLRLTWRYLFKKSRSWAPWQFWMEVMAYRIGQIMDVPVPPAHVGLSNTEKPGQATYGALIEWFYGPDRPYVEGARCIGWLTPGFDHKTGKPHCWDMIRQSYFFLMNAKSESEEESYQRKLVYHWAKVLAFDAVIGNTDRHPVNWGIVLPPPQLGPRIDPDPEFSPAFDNGTAMSYGELEKNFGRFDDEDYANLYLTRPKKAKHHMRWSLDDEADVNFFEFMRRFVSEYPETRPIVTAMLRFTEGDLRTRLEPLVRLDVEEPARLTRRRLDFTIELIVKRTELLREAMERE